MANNEKLPNSEFSGTTGGKSLKNLYLSRLREPIFGDVRELPTMTRAAL